jgi:hypothetical protein
MSANEMTVENLLRAHAPAAPESLRSRVLAVEPRRAPSRRLVLVIGVALVVAIAAAVVGGLTSSSGTKPTAATAPKAFSAAAGAAPRPAASAIQRIAAQLGGTVRVGPRTVVVTVPAAKEAIAAARLSALGRVVARGAPANGVVRITLKLRP